MISQDFIRTVPLKSKTGKDVARALETIFRDGGKTDSLRCDKGNEWDNKIVQKLLKFFQTNIETKASIAEHVIRTVKSIYFKHMTQHQTFRYIDIIADVTNAYNHGYHRTIIMRPVDVTVENQSEVWYNIYGGKKKFKIKNFTFNIGDWVRISFLKELFDREY